jgi:hypothetical protein
MPALSAVICWTSAEIRLRGRVIAFALPDIADAKYTQFIFRLRR